MIIKYVLKRGTVSPCGKYYNTKTVSGYYSLWSLDHKGKYNCVKINVDLNFAQKELYRNKKIELV